MKVPEFMFCVINPMVRFSLRSPLHVFVSHNIMLIRYVGRKTGKHYEIPVRYAERDGAVKCFTDKTAGWWPNLRDNSEVSLVIRGSVMKVSTQVVVDDTELLTAELTKHLNEFPGDAVYKDVRLDHQRRPAAEDIAKHAEVAVLVIATPVE
ncbi:MAG: DUF385 domain-containing protein [Gammaproteobacteria bacterium]|nr:DUF385 domain-containing protein [Gammaproteobacteria bacterium]MYF02151.1 DUF385 domain-containing protein [Gammaproteobacteria bacterium]MYI77846.1 DUF385 domain-containing protein [Gammaproteobacteria bacterium]